MCGALCELRQQVKPEHSAPTGADDVFLGFNLAGISVVTQHNDEVVVTELNESERESQGISDSALNRDKQGCLDWGSSQA